MSDIPVKVLLIDDDEDDYIITYDLLAEIGEKRFDLQWVETFEAGLEAVLDNQHDVYLLDYHLGQRDGLELLREAIRNGCEAPIILLTGQGDQEVDLEAMKAGAADYLIKGQIRAPLLDRSIRYALERAQTLKSLKESEERFRRLVELNPEMIAVEYEEKLIYVNAAGVKLLGATQVEELMDQSILAYVHPNSRETVAEHMRQIQVEQESARPIEVEAVQLNGQTINVSLWATPIIYDGKSAIQVTISDITERKQLEEQLIQARKMEAVGQLAGGIAHDFNNTLTAINGFAELIKFQLGSRDPQELAALILESGQRAAELVQQLMAFSRKQIIKPKVLNLNEVVNDMDKMLWRVIGEDIVLQTNLVPDLWPVKVDPTQLEQVIVNLAVNARDAMPTGGKLTIKTANLILSEDETPSQLELESEQYVLLTISDTGVGMSEATKARIFEPFFTTKEIGKGTGLGLATVFGIVKQNHGDIRVLSQEGEGTTFEIYLPLAEGTIGTSTRLKGDQEIPAGRETILVVEDNQVVRDLTREILQSQGYTLLEAPDGERALELAATQAGSIDLLLTDVLMPGMRGPALAERLIKVQPGLRVLFISGYTDDVPMSSSTDDPKIAFLSKPFNMPDLTRKIREMLDS